MGNWVQASSFSGSLERFAVAVFGALWFPRECVRAQVLGVTDEIGLNH